ncbi:MULTISPECIES: MFS transporter [unclassified Lactobacillus]|uniref:MFS transporter n=1 Tax=unclassified Lactobacillus TaxID=2620435 RepID=UPI000EFD4639|nr:MULTISPECIES: MFS transporter [unclassified Lactobacillus]RMC25039.1 MFS transporter [Lactobacillus sp. ESL0247]RMC29194.1 MFS transporter [Lactobacillus sp. ESL0246]RMC32797.1 MFS transporter [Lactobacillus sp. ESL0245]
MNEKSNSIKHVLAIISCALMAFVTILTETSLNVTFPTLMKQFHIGLGLVQWTTTGYLLMIAIIMVSSSYLNERFSARQLFLTAAVTFIGGSLIASIATNFWILLMGRLISSFGAGLSIPLMFNLVVELMPQEKWGFYMGITGLVIILAPSLGPTFGGSIVYYFGWPLIFQIVAGLAFIILLLGISVIEQYHEKTDPAFDWVNYAIIVMAMVIFNLGFNRISNGLGDAGFWVSMIVVAILIVIFIKLSQTSNKKLIDLKIFKNKPFIFAMISYLLLQFINIGTSFILPNYVQIVNHENSLIGGLVLLPGCILSGLLNPWFGDIYDRKGAKVPLLTGTIFCFTASVLFAAFGLKISTLMVGIFYGIMIIGRQMAFNNTMAEASKLQPEELHTDATAVFQTGQQYAGSMGTTVMATIVSTWQKKSGNYAMLTAQGTQIAFVVMAIISVIILLSYLTLFRLEQAE